MNTTSASGGSIPALKKPGRAVITATKSGTEKNATVFARYWVEALQDPAADVDKNEAISALEAFQYAERKTAEFYTSQKRLATEHPQFEDTGKGEPCRAAVHRKRTRACCSPASLWCASATRRRPRRSGQARTARQEGRTRTADRYAEVSEGGDGRGRLQAAVEGALVELARVQPELDK